MPRFIITKTERYEIEAHTLADARQTWREFTMDGALEDDVEFLDGFEEFEEEEVGA